MYLIKRTESLLRTQMDPIARAAGLTIAQYTALSILHARPGMSSAELARRTFVSAQAANELVNGLHRKGLILRRPSPEHGKILRLRLSKKGETVLRKCALAMQELEELIHSALDGDTRTFHHDLMACIAILEANGGR